MPASKKASKKNGKAPAKKPAAAPKKEAPSPPKRAPPKPTYAPPPRPAPKPAPAAPQAPEFVKNASPAERKAALEALIEKEGVAALPAPAAPAPKAPPTFVRESPAAERKAAMEKVVDEQGVTGLLSKAPWKRPAPPTPPPAPAAPVERTAPKVQMTKTPIEQTTGRNKPQTVILDSNALMMQFQFHIDIEKEVNRLLSGNYHYVVPQIVVDELARIAKEGTGKEAAEARMAGELAKTFEIVESPGDGDVGILRLAEKLNAIVVTNDKRLRATLRAKDIANIYMRSRAFLTVDGHIPGM